MKFTLASTFALLAATVVRGSSFQYDRRDLAPCDGSDAAYMENGCGYIRCPDGDFAPSLDDCEHNVHKVKAKGKAASGKGGRGGRGGGRGGGGGGGGGGGKKPVE